MARIGRKRTLPEIKEKPNRNLDLPESVKTKTVYGTGKSKHMKQGMPYVVGYSDAEYLISKGIASAEKPAPAKKETVAKEA